MLKRKKERLIYLSGFFIVVRISAVTDTVLDIAQGTVGMVY